MNRSYKSIEIFGKCCSRDFFLESLSSSISYDSILKYTETNNSFGFEINKLLYCILSVFQEKEVIPKDGHFNFEDFIFTPKQTLSILKLFFEIDSPFLLSVLVIKNHDKFYFDEKKKHELLKDLLYNIDTLRSPLMVLYNMDNSIEKLNKEYSALRTKNSVDGVSRLTSLDIRITELKDNIKNRVIAHIKKTVTEIEFAALNREEKYRLIEHKLHRSNIIFDISDEIANVIQANENSEGVDISSLMITNPKALTNQYLPIYFKMPYKLVSADTINSVIKMRASYPHFKEVLDFIISNLKANYYQGNKVLKLKPILLLGSNGIGKSSFIDEISKIFGFHSNSINIGSLTSPAELSGLDSGWGTGKPGLLAISILNNNCVNPLVLLDEVDKSVQSTSNGKVTMGLYDVLEKRSAVKFYENYFNSAFDFSHMNFMATCNDLKTIDKGILDRFKIFGIEKPTEEMLPAIIRSIYNTLREDDLYKIVSITDDSLNAFTRGFQKYKIFNVRQISKSMDKIFLDALSTMNSEGSIVVDYLDDSHLEPPKGTRLH